MGIGKTGTTKTSASLINYLLRRQKEAERQPRIIGGNITGKTKKEIKAELKDQEKLNSKVKNTIAHFIISFAVGEQISDEDAADYAEELMDAMEFGDNPFLVVRHYDKEKRAVNPYAHLHIAASRIKNDGTLVSEWDLAERFIEAVKTADHKFGFESVEYVKSERGADGERNIKKNEYQMMARKSRLSILEEFKDCAEQSLREKKDLRGFVGAARAAGFEVSPNIDEETATMKGFAFSKGGIVFTAKKAGDRFKWANLAEEIDYQHERDANFLVALKAEFAAKKEAETRLKEQLKEQEKTQIKNQAQDQSQLKKQAQTAKQAQIKEASQDQILIESEGSNKLKTQNIQLAAEESNQTQTEIAEVETNETTGKCPATEQSATARISVPTERVGDEQSFRTGSDDGSRSLANNDGNSGGERSSEKISSISIDTQTELPAQSGEMDEASRVESGAVVQKTEIVGGKSAALRDSRIDDQTARSGEQSKKDESDEFAAKKRDETLGADHHAENERGFEGGAKRGDEFVESNRLFEDDARFSHQTNRSRETGTGDGGEEISGISGLGGADESADQRGFEHQRFTHPRTSNQDQRGTNTGNQPFTESINTLEKSGQHDSAPSKRSGETGEILAKLDGQKPFSLQNSDLGDSSGISDTSGFDNQLLPSDSTTDSELKLGEKQKRGAVELDRPFLRGQTETDERFESNDADAAANLSGGGEFLQNESAGTVETGRTERKSNRQGSKGRAAETAAQLINVKRYGGQLHLQIITSWISIIEQTDAAKFLDEIVRPQSAEEQAKVDDQLNRQIAVVAEQLKLPVPKPEAKMNHRKLAAALTKVETANYEQASGTSLGDKVFEVLVEKNLRLHDAAAPPVERIEALRETFGEQAAEPTLKSLSALEAATLDALLDSVKYGFVMV